MNYPIFIDFTGKKVLTVGGGKVGTRRAIQLTNAGARVTVISKSFTKELEESKVKLIKADATEKIPNLEDFFLVVIASNDRKVNEYVGRKAFKAGILVNRADEHDKGDVIFPMTGSIEGHALAYTTLGENPGLLARLKKLIENEFKSR